MSGSRIQPVGWLVGLDMNETQVAARGRAVAITVTALLAVAVLASLIASAVPSSSARDHTRKTNDNAMPMTASTSTTPNPIHAIDIRLSRASG